jgi:hypothetical protein
LPPPVFPPGGHRLQMRHRVVADRDRGTREDHSFTWSDASIMWGPAGLDGAIIFPDDPIPPRAGGEPAPGVTAALEGMAGIRGGASDEEVNIDDVVVTGIGDDRHLSSAELAYGWDPHMADLVETVKKLAAALDRRGEGGLRTTPGMSRLEAQLRGYCVGFLAGRRAGDPDI